MKKSGTVPKKNDTTRQTLEFSSALLSQAPHLDPEVMQWWIENKDVLKNVLADALLIPDPRKEWECFYQEEFGKEVDFSDLELPEKQKGFNWLILMLEGLTPNKLYDKCKESFKSGRYKNDLDTIKSVRTTDNTYAVWVRDRIEADKENKNKSVNDCDKEGIKGITLEEMLLLILFRHWLTGKNLDVENITLCAGSRDFNGKVPDISMRNNDGDLNIEYSSLGSASDVMRVRATIS